jgi:hypothetical protein
VGQLASLMRSDGWVVKGAVLAVVRRQVSENAMDCLAIKAV